MSEGIVPLRRSGEERSPIARVDIAAVELLVSGEAISLQTARAEVILKDLRAQRDQMSTRAIGDRFSPVRRSGKMPPLMVQVPARFRVACASQSAQSSRYVPAVDERQGSFPSTRLEHG
ncbi:hypothetical protein MKL09_29585, partial [Methylobacterium sp. J-048]|uniref:hypothetical protein n=1 Tax=Methylobacterium sp. J-048 TaxID=2836635 RepID=UPI001FB9B2EA